MFQNRVVCLSTSGLCVGFGLLSGVRNLLVCTQAMTGLHDQRFPLAAGAEAACRQAHLHPCMAQLEHSRPPYARGLRRQIHWPVFFFSFFRSTLLLEYVISINNNSGTRTASVAVVPAAHVNEFEKGLEMLPPSFVHTNQQQLNYNFIWITVVFCFAFVKPSSLLRR